MKSCNFFAVGVIVGAIATATLCAKDKKPLPPPPKDCCDCAKPKPKRKNPECNECCYELYRR